MKKKKILTLGPITAHPDELLSIANTLTFLDKTHTIDYLDSLLIMEDLPNTAYYKLWEEKLTTYLTDYDAFLGFSFGGVIIQQCFPLFQNIHKPIILLSAPTFADNNLTQKLGAVIRLCQEKKLIEALNTLYQPVFYPHPIPNNLSHMNHNKAQAYKRLIFGLTRVLQTDATTILQNNQVPHLHLIGEYSALVNKKM